ncbi:FxLD family lanthipeptide [Streptomyces sp. 11-1-2]|uniref:FxLD family lanthipeptide n=1 Tax=unclassified Streptomyces TaxID=2593676 RepID=UPI000E732A2D|nr:FxLD family lanthipeptide [Streptomyces sp. 11-1-2]
MSVQIAESAAPPIGPTTAFSGEDAPPIGPSAAILPFSGEDWELEVSVTDTPRPVASDDCDTSDGCESSCASSCTSD